MTFNEWWYDYTIKNGKRLPAVTIAKAAWEAASKAPPPEVALPVGLEARLLSMGTDHVVRGGPGPLFNAGWAKACEFWSKKLRDEFFPRFGDK